MQFILLILITAVCLSMQDIFKKCYSCVSEHKKMGIYTYYLISVLVAMVVFLANYGGDAFFEPKMIPYACGFAVSYFCAVFFTLKAIEVGSLSLTSLIISYSLLIPSLYGIIFLGEKITAIKIIGYVMLSVSLFCVKPGKVELNSNRAANKKMCLYIAIAFVGNGLCSTLQKVYQLESGGRGKSEFMLISLGIVAAAFFVLRLMHRKTERVFLPTAENGGWYGAAVGLCNGIVNWLMMVMASKPASIVYPSVSAGAIVLTLIASKVFFKERHTRIQDFSFVIGVFSIIFLNI